VDPDARPDPHDHPDGCAQPIGQRDADGSADADFAPRHALGIPHDGPVSDLPPLPYVGPQPDRDRAAGRGPDACPEPFCDLHPEPGRHVVTCPRADLDTLRDAFLAALYAGRVADARDLYRRITAHPDR
jgi:hypothetical protein